VVGNIDPMLTEGQLLNKADKRIGVTRDFYRPKFVEWFNAGVVVINPDQKEYTRLMKLITEKSVHSQGQPNKDGWVKSTRIVGKRLVSFTMLIWPSTCVIGIKHGISMPMMSW